MKYELLVLDLDGTLTNSRKEITAPTREALIEIQEAGKKVVLASGRPPQGIYSLAEQLKLEKYGSFILSFNGAKIIDCRSKKVIYNRVLPQDVIRPIYEIAREYPVDIGTYENDVLISGICPNQYTELEAQINKLSIQCVDNFGDYVTFPVNKMIIYGDPSVTIHLEEQLKKQFHKRLNIYRSEPFFLEIMPQNIDKAYSLQKLINSIGLTADQMICCGDGYNDLSMIEYAGLGVAMGNAQPLIRERADYITKSNDEDGVLLVINEFMRD